MNQSINNVLKIDYQNLNAYSTGLLQGKAYRALNSALSKTLLQYDLTIPEWKLLGQLNDHGALRLADLSERLNVEAPLVTALIDKLEKKKLVTRKNHPNDKRAKIITLVKSGADVLTQAEPQVKAVMNKLLKGVDREQLLNYLTVLKTIVDNAE